jgi:segregation and condensation protein B
MSEENSLLDQEVSEETNDSPEATSFDPQLLQRILEGALLAAGEALPLERIQSLFEEASRPAKSDLLAALAALRERCQGRGYDLVEVASGWRFQVATDLAPWVNRLWEEKPQKYSRALLETLALIAYRQPITRSDIEEVRGVAVSSHIIKTLAEREWIKVVGHRDVPGRPSLYATTRQFLDYFGLKSLDELPSLGELKDIDSLNQDLQLLDDELQVEREQIAAAREDTGEPATASLFDGEPIADDESASTDSAAVEAEDESVSPERDIPDL